MLARSLWKTGACGRLGASRGIDAASRFGNQEWKAAPQLWTARSGFRFRFLASTRAGLRGCVT
jgi:hypothetical protein